MKTYPVFPGTYKLTPHLCPKCKSNLFIRSVDALWCSNEKCSYAELHLVGEGARRTETIAIVTVK